MNWYIGQKVVCIKREGWNDDGLPPPSRMSEVGQTYTIRDISGCRCRTQLYVGHKVYGGSSCSECDADISTDRHRLWEPSENFRPLEPLKEDMDRIEESFVKQPEPQHR